MHSRSCWCCCGPRSVPRQCSAACWHYCSLVFAEHPLRRHRSWMGAVVPCPAEHNDADRDAIGADMAADGRCGSTKRRLPFGASEPGAKKCVPQTLSSWASHCSTPCCSSGPSHIGSAVQRTSRLCKHRKKGLHQFHNFLQMLDFLAAQVPTTDCIAHM